MPGYYDWKIRNCTLGARDKAASLLETMEAVDPTLHAAWDENGGSFPGSMNVLLADVVAKIDRAEDALEKARLQLATLLPGHP